MSMPCSELWESGFLLMPRGAGFVEFAVFDAAYEALKQGTRSFREMTADKVMPLVLERPVCLIVLRSMLGFTPSEWAYHASRHVGIELSQNAARTIDRDIRLAPKVPVSASAKVRRKRIHMLVESACALLAAGPAEEVRDALIHRLDKADTKEGLTSVVAAAELGAPYSMLLYERLLGRPFASHRDSVSELVGDIVENAVEGRTRAQPDQLQENEAGRAGARIRSEPGLHGAERTQPARGYRGEVD